MPVIRIDFDATQNQKDHVIALSKAVQAIVSEVTGIEDVFVYANDSEIKVKVAPIEIFVQMSRQKIKDIDALVQEIKTRLSAWKKDQAFPHPINLSFIPMEWKIEIGI